MHRTLLAAAALAFSSSLALAADIPVPVYKAPVIAPVMSWTGFYAGLNGGYTWGHQSVDPYGSVGGSAITRSAVLKFLRSCPLNEK